jgi:MFS family permease
MARRDAWILLGVLGVGVFLAGLELMVTAVALPSILRDVSNITDLRHAAWIVNGYLLVYVVAMPLAGRLADLWGTRRLLYAGLVAFTLGSLLAGAAPTLDLLIRARLVQAVGGGILVPVGTAAAAHLFDGHARSRALGVVGGLTFLGMAAGPFVGAAVLGSLHPADVLAGAGLTDPTLVHALVPAWRWVFYLNVPFGIVALVLAWAATRDWDTPRRSGSVDLVGAGLFSLVLAGGLGALSLLGSTDPVDGGPDPLMVAGALAIVAVAAFVLYVRHALRRADPFLDLRLFRDRVFASAALVSLLTGYAFATTIVGGALFVDRVLYGGPGDQQVALGALAGATALGALVSGFAIRAVPLRAVSIAGLAASALALVAMGRWDANVQLGVVAGSLAVFGFGFGLTVTPRSTAAVEAAGRAAYGAASATVTVARMIGMAVGLTILAAYGSTVIAHLYDQVYGTPDGYKAFIPTILQDRPLKDPLVVGALETWAAGEASSVMVGLFVVAAGVTIAAVPAAFALRPRARILSDDAAPPAVGRARPYPGESDDDSDDQSAAFSI